MTDRHQRDDEGQRILRQITRRIIADVDELTRLMQYEPDTGGLALVERAIRELQSVAACRRALAIAKERGIPATHDDGTSAGESDPKFHIARAHALFTLAERPDARL